MIDCGQRKSTRNTCFIAIRIHQYLVVALNIGSQLIYEMYSYYPRGLTNNSIQVKWNYNVSTP